jgi:hypothetical protein
VIRAPQEPAIDREIGKSVSEVGLTAEDDNPTSTLPVLAPEDRRHCHAGTSDIICETESLTSERLHDRIG